MLEIHDSGAVVMFVFAAFYFWLQTHISYKVAQYGAYSPWLCYLRLTLSLLMTASATLYFVSSIVSFHFYNNGTHYHSVALWGPETDGYILHVISNAAEWFSFLLMILFAVTYFDEFQQVILIIDCQKKSPTIISYDGIGDYSSLKMSSMDSLIEDNNNQQE